jgi:GTP-dependent phosphoenolpyruvate carboxykinase
LFNGCRIPYRRRISVGGEAGEARPKVFLLLFLQKKKNPSFLHPNMAKPAKTWCKLPQRHP